MTKNTQCWNCQTGLDTKDFFCDKCSKIQSPKISNYFDLFDMDEMYEIDDEKLEKRYLELQQLFHPDKFLSFSEKEINYSTRFSSIINEAYHNLGNSYLRANLILKSQGFNVSDENKSFNDEDVLQEIMELQNKCFDLEDLDSKNSVLGEIESKIKNTILNISKSFNNKDYKKANKNNIKLSYLEKMKKNLKSSL